MITGKNKILDFVSLNNSPYWQVRRGEGSAPIMEYNPAPPILASIDESKTRLQTLLNMLDNGTYFIEAWESAGQKKGWFKDSFQINENGYGSFNPSQISGVQVPSITPEDIEKRISEALERDREKRRFEALEAENKDLLKRVKEINEANDAFWLRVMKRAEPYIEPIMNGLGILPQTPAPATAAISGIHGNENKQQMANEINDRAERALERWFEKDQDCITLMEKIVELAETKPEIYTKAKGLLMNPTMLSFLG